MTFEATEERIAIVVSPFDVDEAITPFGKRWGDERFRLTTEHLAALQNGKTLALDVPGEHVVFVMLEKPKHGQ